MKLNKYLPTAVMLVLLTGASAAVAQESFDIEKYFGDWQGSGEVYVPYMGTSITIEGQAAFTPDSMAAFVRTAVTATAFMLTYSDSGQFVLDSATDSVTWKIWDSFGRYSLYRGKTDGADLIGRRHRSSLDFRMKTEFVTSDSMVVVVSTTDAKGASTERARLNLGRKR